MTTVVSRRERLRTELEQQIKDVARAHLAVEGGRALSPAAPPEAVQAFLVVWSRLHGLLRQLDALVDELGLSADVGVR